MVILVTGGMGFIGSHTCVELLADGYEVIVADDLSNSHETVKDKIEEIAGKKIKFYRCDVCDDAALERIFSENDIGAVIHFAGLKAVGESVEKPLEYYRTNIDSTLSLCRVMRAHGVCRFVFSSSATVYGETNQPPLREDMPYGEATNPYGQTKTVNEHILRDMHRAYPDFSVSLLRYFNPVGAHPSGLIGEDPQGIPNNLFPYISRTAVGKLKKLTVYGDDYDTPDGTGVRDYIHVCDLARGHVLAIRQLIEAPGLYIYNLGTGRGSSVLEVIHAFEKACGHAVPYEIGPRRAGDLASLYADVSKAKNGLGFVAEHGLDEMCADGWNYIVKNS